MRSIPGPVRDEAGRLWVNSAADRQIWDKAHRERQGDGVTPVEPPKPVRVPVTLDGVPLFGEVWARRYTTRGWEGLVLLEREYAPGWWHLQCRWLPAGQIEVLDHS